VLGGATKGLAYAPITSINMRHVADRAAIETADVALADIAVATPLRLKAAPSNCRSMAPRA
jgi:hypothetical protein